MLYLYNLYYTYNVHCHYMMCYVLSGQDGLGEDGAFSVRESCEGSEGAGAAQGINKATQTLTHSQPHRSHFPGAPAFGLQHHEGVKGPN